MGLIFNKPAQLPTVLVDQNHIRVYYSFRLNTQSFVNFFDTDTNDPCRIKYENQYPIFTPGKKGCFDDSGVMPSSIVNFNGRDILFYTGWNIDKGKVPYGHGIGIAELCQDRVTRKYDGPVLDRTIETPYLVNSARVLNFENKLEMWFCNGIRWDENFPIYTIAHALSDNGINWIVDKKSEFGKIDFAYSRPAIMKKNGQTSVWCSCKSKNTPYQIMYARQQDACWLENYDNVFDNSTQDWESEMVCYPEIFNIDNTYYMYYNGNGYGQTGVGLAIWRD
jgi:hypothetical protein